MKAEHRKELQTNALADHLGKWLQTLKTGPKPTAVVVAVFIVLVIGLIFAWGWYATKSSEERAQLWLSFDNAASLGDLEMLSEKHQGTEVALLSQFQEARIKLREGLKDLYASLADSRTKAQEKVKEAGDLYERLIPRARNTPVLYQEALLGIASARESLGDISGAIGFYGQLKDSYTKGTPAYEQIDAYLAKLEKGKADVAKFYDDLQKITSETPKFPGSTP
jgi:tetratricopeptide (TPR) repeat protein